MAIGQSPEEILNHFKSKKGRESTFDEDYHCKLLIKVMLDKDKGRVSSFCVEAMIDDSCFYKWVNKYELFGRLYYYCKLVAREIWEQEGCRLRDEEYPMGTINYAMEHWKMVGWTRFGVGKTSRIKLALNPEDSPVKHYAQILRQAQEGDFTAAEIKQLMEAVNVGLNTHQVFELQKQIDELKSDLATMQANQNVQNPFANKGTA